MLALISLAYLLFSQQEEERSSRPASPDFAPPVDPVPPNLNTGEIPDRLKRFQDVPQYPGNSFENGYRGVIAANANSSSAKDELIVDFGSNGVWAYDGLPDLGTWHQISGANPDWIFSVHWGDTDDDEIIGDFGSLGLWMWDYSGYPGTWTQLSGANADHGFAADDDGDGKEEIQVDFGSLGLWRYDLDDTSWIQLSTLNADPGGIGKDHWVTGTEEGVWSFPGFGVWSFDQGVSIFQLSGSDASYPNVSAEFGIGDDSEELIMSFGDSLGLWLAEEDTYPDVLWHQLSGEDPVGLKEVRWVDGVDYELLVDFRDVDGLWCWDYSGYPGSWVKLSDNDPGEGYFEPFDPNGYSIEIGGDEEVAVDFDTLGLWLYDSTTGGFTQLTASDPEYMVRADLYNSGDVDEWLIVDFGTAGLWAYNGFAHSWHQLSALSPD
jgi:hypothetical protein